jgi:hypothetical protein
MSSGPDQDSRQIGLEHPPVQLSGNFVVEDDAQYREAMARLDAITAEWSEAVRRFCQENGLREP